MDIILSKFTNNNSNPWISHSIKKLSRRKQHVYNCARLSHHPDDWRLYHQLKKECQHECRKAYDSYVLSLVDCNNNVSKRMWSYIKNKKVDYCGVAPLRYNDTLYTDSKDKASILNNYFTSVFTMEDGSIPIMDGTSFPDISPLFIFDESVANLLSNLDDHKVNGPDGIPATLLKKLATFISPVLTIIFHASLHQGLIPIYWKSANIVPIFKEGERCNPSNYRSVSLICICSKLLEHIIYSHIFLHLKKYDILCEEQHGF